MVLHGSRVADAKAAEVPPTPSDVWHAVLLARWVARVAVERRRLSLLHVFEADLREVANQASAWSGDHGQRLLAAEIQRLLDVARDQIELERKAA